VRSCNHRCSAKAISNTYCECVFLFSFFRAKVYIYIKLTNYLHFLLYFLIYIIYNIYNIYNISHIIFFKKILYVKYYIWYKLKNIIKSASSWSILYILWVCVCSLSYLSLNAHAPHCHQWPVRLRVFSS